MLVLRASPLSTLRHHVAEPVFSSRATPRPPSGRFLFVEIVAMKLACLLRHDLVRSIVGRGCFIGSLGGLVDYQACPVDQEVALSSSGMAGGGLNLHFWGVQHLISSRSGLYQNCRHESSFMKHLIRFGLRNNFGGELF